MEVWWTIFSQVSLKCTNKRLKATPKHYLLLAFKNPSHQCLNFTMTRSIEKYIYRLEIPEYKMTWKVYQLLSRNRCRKVLWTLFFYSESRTTRSYFACHLWNQVLKFLNWQIKTSINKPHKKSTKRVSMPSLYLI